jgi:hypothetical protein
MSDVMFLKHCGIEVDSRWLALLISQDSPDEIQNYVNDLLRISNLFA